MLWVKRKQGRKIDEGLLFYMWVVQVDFIERVTFEQRAERNLQHQGKSFRGRGKGQCQGYEVKLAWGVYGPGMRPIWLEKCDPQEGVVGVRSEVTGAGAYRTCGVHAV